MQKRRAIDVTPEVEAWRNENPVRKWIDAQPHGVGFVRITKSLDVTRSAVYTWIHGKSLPPADTLLDLCALIGVGYRTYIRWWRKFPDGRTAASTSSTATEGQECPV